MFAKLFQKTKVKLFHVVLLCSLLFIVSVPFYADMKSRVSSSDLKINMYKSSLESAIYRYKFLPFILSQNQKVVDILTGEMDKSDSGYFLQRMKYATNVSNIFVMDRDGTTIAASNWHSYDSYIGKNYSVRPYFKAAMAGRLGQFYGIGLTSLTPGFFISYGLKTEGQIVGVIAIEINLSDLEEIWSSGPDEIAVYDVNNIIFLSSNPDWKNKTFGDIAPGAMDRVDSEKRFVKKLLRPIALERCFRFGDLTFYGDGDMGCVLPSKFSIEEGLIDFGWTIVSLQDTDYYYADMLVCVLLSILIYLILIFAYKNFDNRYKRRVQKLRNQLVENSKLASIGQMATELAHEFNQPLSAIYMLLDTTRILLDRKLYRSVDENLMHVASHIERMTQQISELKSFASRHRVPRGNADIVAVANASIRLFQQTLKKSNVQLGFQFSHAELHVPCNEIGLEQIFSNLITNALEAMAAQDKKHINISIIKKGKRIEVRVRDNGPGIPEVERIFESYYTTKQRGTGLGLAIVKGIVENSIGSISARNPAAGGAEFVIKWPEWAPEYAESETVGEGAQILSEEEEGTPGAI